LKGCRLFLFSESRCSVCIGENAAIIVCMKLRNCRWATYNEPAIRFVPARPAHNGSWGRSCGYRLIRTRQHYYHSGGSPQFVTDGTWHSCMPVPGGQASKPTAGLTASSAGCLLQYVLVADISLADEPFCWQILLPRWATKSINNACVRFVMFAHRISISEGHTCRLFRISCENCDRQSVGCSELATEDVTDGRTDGLSLSRNVCCLQRAVQNGTPSPQLIWHFNVHVSSGHGVGRHLHVQRCELRSIAV